MPSINIKKGVSSVTRETSDGAWMPARGTRDGAVYMASWYDSLSLEGRVFTVNSGTDTSPAEFAGAYNGLSPDLTIDIPKGTIAIPLSIEVVIQTSGATLFEVMALASSTPTAPTVGTVLYPKNIRIDQNITSVATCYGSIYSTSCTDPHAGDYFEFFRAGYPSDPDVSTTPAPTYRWSARVNGPPPIISNGGSIVVYVGGTTGTGFITATWAELPESFIK